MEAAARLRQAFAAEQRAASGTDKITGTIFWQKSASMFVLDFGYSDDGRSIGREITTRMGPSLAIALPTFLIGLVAYVSFALLMTLFRATALDMGCGVVRAADVGVRPVLHHRRAVRGEQAVASGAHFRL